MIQKRYVHQLQMVKYINKLINFINLIFFRELYRGSMMNILLDIFAKEFTNVKDINKIEDIKMIDNNFIVLDAIKLKSLEYLTDEHYIFSWFSENYERVDVTNQTAFDYISLRDVYNHLTRTEYYRNLAPSVKRTLSQK